ncbi:MAG: hypothetical protein HRT35_03415 [Algicola sp.]|nr:hypothetical protein [Algicola sp.]
MIKQILGSAALVAVGLSTGIGIGINITAKTGVVSPQLNAGSTVQTEMSVVDDQWSIWPSAANDKPDGLSRDAKAPPLNIAKTAKAIVAQPTQFKQFAAAYPVALSANEKQLGQMINALMAMEKSELDSIGIARIFYVRYINLNPQDASEHFWLTVPEESPQHRRVMFNIYHEWAWTDMDKALEDITTNVVEKNRENLISFLLGDDHFTTNAALLTLAQNYSERTRTAALLAAAQRESNETAFERMVAMPKNSDARRHGLYRLARRWAKSDPQAALQRIKEMVNSGSRQSLISTVISVWAETDAEQALLGAIGINEGNNYAYAALSTLAKKDGVRALELTEQYQDKLDGTVKNQVMQTWASSDPRAAANYLEQKGAQELKNDARQIAWHYTLQHPEEAYQWAERVGLLNDSNIASNMGNALVQADLGKAEELFAGLPPSASRDGLFTNIVRQRSKVDIAQTHKWLSQYSEEAKFKEAQNNLLYEWTRRDPQQSAEVVVAMEDNANKSGHLSSIATNWYDKSPDSALRWVLNLPEGDMRDRTIATLARKVNRYDSEEAAFIAAEISNLQIQQGLMRQLNAGNP